MSGGAEFIGDIATGALAARAAEPDHGEGDGHTDEAACLNCGTALIGSHCHQCGQTAHVHRTIAAFFHDLMHGVFHFEGKIWRTLPMLAWKPGQLTREYIEGRRASYVSPIALFLFVVFLTFAVFNAVGDPIQVKPQSPEEIVAAIKSADSRLAELKQEKAAAEAKGEDVPGIDGQISGAEAALEAIKAGRETKAVEITTDSGASSGPDWARDLNEEWDAAAGNPDLAIYKLQSNAYKYSWLLIPLSVPFLWLLFPFSRRFHIYDHTIFVTYSLCFMMVLLSIATLGAVNQAIGWLTAPAVLYAPLHLYRQLRGAYGLSRRGALIRLPLLLFFAMLALTLWASVIMLLVAAG